ncbi:family 43 glycosylhydrolase [Pedobacter insulae]|uniref:Glycosyl hydrolases family 43 n=1 Tax=Pedobacter insulae TaxID=414048 RepID=A0A1I2Z9Z3_9SPHI|nr:family 43 glycosylhydrolase [Pedobacter insulae]SFH34405.1 Glycosyl hydrolases family 43 [Pedobacter insulae]
MTIGRSKIKDWLVLILLGVQLQAFCQKTAKNEKLSAYLFVYFAGNGLGEESIRFALSKDGFTYRALNQNNPVIDPKKISSTGGVRDPHILRSHDGKTFYMVVTDMKVAENGWGPNFGMVLLKSIDLVNWTSQTINIPQRFPEMAHVNRVWAPQTIYDPAAGKYMVYWSMRFGKDPDKIYYAYANKDFTDLETTPQQLFFSPDNSACIDGDIVFKNGKYHLFFKTEDQKPGIKKAVSSKLTGGYTMVNPQYLQQTNEAVEGAGTFKLNQSDTWVLMYDVYIKGKYQFTTTNDLENFTVADHQVSMDFHPRHGTVLPITQKEANTLAHKWKAPKNLESTAQQARNPLLGGLYADPEIIYAKKTGKFYIYPTSDGFTGWSGTSFKAFSSIDLINWKDEGVILDLPKDVSWAQKNAWAPTIIEKKINGTYKYFYYFTAAQKIGVAVGDNPTGPFVDSGKPLISSFPLGITKGQQIDPAVFNDPKTGNDYLYWGNGYMAGVKLNPDMTSIDTTQIKILTPTPSYNEGTHVFYRKGTYYFLWSENDTRSEDYQVRYGTSSSPLGPINVPANNLVLAKNREIGIFGTGHHSVIQIPGKDEWYIVYHRFSYPNGIKMGRAAGYNREVCIDKLEFNSDGSIKLVIPTHKGIKPIKVAK